MLAQTTSVDDGVSYDLTCDGCGAVFAAPAEFSRDPAALWDLAERFGWRMLAAGPQVAYRCHVCVRASATETGDGTGR